MNWKCKELEEEVKFPRYWRERYENIRKQLDKERDMFENFLKEKNE